MGTWSFITWPKDVGEQENLVQKEPVLAKQLHEELSKWRQSRGSTIANTES